MNLLNFMDENKIIVVLCKITSHFRNFNQLTFNRICNGLKERQVLSQRVSTMIRREGKHDEK